MQIVQAYDYLPESRSGEQCRTSQWPVFKAYEHDFLIGQLKLDKNAAGNWYINNIVVFEKGRGIGTALLKAAEAEYGVIAHDDWDRLSEDAQGWVQALEKKIQ